MSGEPKVLKDGGERLPTKSRGPAAGGAPAGKRHNVLLRRVT